ncbi:MAG: hypothetical protein FWG45_01140, partial [Oscillospiraceae bacterium]|nr:hypothetical protein [Oscillospiraceae bacterium]
GDVGDLAKIFNPDKRDGKEEKLKAMLEIKSPRPSYSYAWPKDLLYDKKTGEFCGYVMYLKQNKVEIGEVYGYSCRYRTEREFRFFVALARNLAQAVAGVHDKGQVIGDLNDKNILVDVDTCEVTLIDTDSFHIEMSDTTYRCNVGKSEYVPKEVQDIKFAEAKLPTFTRHTDNFSLGILIFKLLMNGVHPFNSVGIDEKSIEDNISDGKSPFFANWAKLDTAFYAPTAEMLPKSLRTLFELAFTKSVNNPEKRPSAREFYDELVQLGDEKNLYSCTEVQWHFYPNASTECPWCAIAKRQEERLAMLAALTEVTNVASVDYSTARYNPVANYQAAQAAVTPEPAAESAAAPETKPEPKSEIKPETKPESKSDKKAETKPETKADKKAETKPETKADKKAETKPEPQADKKADVKPKSEAILVIPSEQKSDERRKPAAIIPFYKTKKFIAAVGGAAAVLLIVIIAIAASGKDKPVVNPRVTQPRDNVTQGGFLMTDDEGNTVEPPLPTDDWTEPPPPTDDDGMTFPPDDTPTDEPTDVNYTTAKTKPGDTTAKPEVTKKPTSTKKPEVTKKPPATTKKPVVTSKPPTTTKPPTSTKAPATTAKAPTERVVYDMQKDGELWRFRGDGSSSQSTHALLVETGGTREVNDTSTPKTIRITRRGGTSQGIEFPLSRLPGPSYRIMIQGSVEVTSGEQSVYITTENSENGVLVSRKNITSTNNTFVLTCTISADEMAKLRNDNVKYFRLGGARAMNLTITAIVITEIT